MQIKQLFNETLQDFSRLIRFDAKLILFFFIFTEFMQRYFLSMKIMGAGRTDMMILTSINSILLSLTESLLLCTLIPLRHLQQTNQEPLETTLWDFIKRFVKPLTLEGLRAFAYVLLWSLLIIIPIVLYAFAQGFMVSPNMELIKPILMIFLLILFMLPAFYKFIQYFFVPFVVVADPRYDRGEIDALKESANTVKGIIFPLLILLFVATGLEFMRNSLRERFMTIDTMHISAIVWLISLTFILFMNVLLFRVYLLRRKVP